ncbi:MAG TPA: hypothetical protein VFN29_01975 [Chiayiivirga sp.]|nr:hypothetical protein [Chiayiivirga sp.]
MNSAPHSMPPALGRLGRARRLLSVAFVAVALAYVCWMLSRHLDELQANLVSLGPGGMLAFLVLATVSIAITTTYHAVLLGEMVAGQLPRMRSCAAYAVGQIVRYLPGKVWGLFYEANVLGGSADLGSITLSVLVQTVLGYAWATALAATILLAAYTGTPALYLLLVPAACALWFAHRIPWPRRFIAALPLLGKRVNMQQQSAGLDASESIRLSALLILNWMPFLVGWIFLLAANHGPVEAVTYGAAYMLASIATTAMVVVPSGLVVREALFTWLGVTIGLPVADLLLYGVVVRLILTLADLLNAGLFVAADWLTRHIAPDWG